MIRCQICGQAIEETKAVISTELEEDQEYCELCAEREIANLVSKHVDFSAKFVNVENTYDDDEDGKDYDLEIDSFKEEQYDIERRKNK